MIGVLALQGDFLQHQEIVFKLGYAPKLVKTAADLDQVDKLILPGGESTTMRLLAKKHGLWLALRKFCQTKPVFGTCAGAILLAKTLLSKQNDEDTLGIVDVAIVRNNYGRQVDSFTTNVLVHGLAQQDEDVPAVFIRAPQITRVGSGVVVLASHAGYPVLVKEDNCWIATFHPELTTNTLIHRYFLN